MKTPKNIVVCKDVSTELKLFVQSNDYSKIAVLVDENTNQYCYPLISKDLPDHHLIKIPSGEEYKNIGTCSHIWEEITHHSFDRNALLINLGGGVIGDMGGFCASTYKRGIDFINLPTTLLSQVDASIGGKLGIDFQGYKNHIGLFRLPTKVFISTKFLRTLNTRELRSGYAEVIKHCLIADKGMFDKINSLNLDQLNWDEIIPHSIAIKNKIVRNDPEEKGLRKILNFGHTIGHAIESHYLDRQEKRLLHGEAVAAGMICESWLSTEKTSLPEKCLMLISSFLKRIYNPKPIPEADIDSIVTIASHDKKNKKGVIMCSLLRKTGQCIYDQVITADDIRNAIQYYNRLITEK